MSDKRAVAERFGANVRHYKEQRGLSLTLLAQRAGIHRTQVGLVIRGKRVVQIDTLIKLASALEVPPGALLDGITWKPEQPGPPGKFELADPGTMLE